MFPEYIVFAQFPGKFADTADHQTEDNDATHGEGKDKTPTQVVSWIDVTKANRQYGDIAEVHGIRVVPPFNPGEDCGSTAEPEEEHHRL